VNSSTGYSADDHDLPVVLQAAADVDAVVDAASFFSRIAVVLPANAPLLIPPGRLAEKSRLQRRSRRSPYREVLAATDADASTDWSLISSGRKSLLNACSCD
jgi:hypothetical protein